MARTPHLLIPLLPPHQRRTISDLTTDLDPGDGDASAKRSAYWTMLLLSGVVATAGVLSDSTATVIGAMIIAPLSTPIMGVALGLAERSPAIVRRSAVAALTGAVSVIAIGLAFSFVLPTTFRLLANSQISGRTSPGLLDLVAAVATGFAGAIALARKDVAAVLPGVAIAISLVPPLAVVGVCLGQGSPGLAAGALLLFVSNLLALVLAGTLVFAVLGYLPDGAPNRRRRTAVVVGGLLLAVGIPLAANTVGNVLLQVWQSRVATVAEKWVSGVPGASVESVDIQAPDVYIEIRTPGELPPTAELMEALSGEVPSGVEVYVTTSLGSQIDAGTVDPG